MAKRRKQWIEKHCVECEQWFEFPPWMAKKNPQCCSRKCGRQLSIKTQAANHKPKTAICPTCTEEFITNGNNRKFCSRECYLAGDKRFRRVEYITKKCEYCQTEMEKVPWESKRRFCSKTCSGRSRETPKSILDRKRREAYESLKKKQNNSCGICGRTQERLAVDHCHSTAKIRGLLCTNCNLKLGWYEPLKEEIEKYLGDVPITGRGFVP